MSSPANASGMQYNSPFRNRAERPRSNAVWMIVLYATKTLLEFNDVARHKTGVQREMEDSLANTRPRISLVRRSLPTMAVLHQYNLEVIR